jgi:hypothetical protein
MGIFYKKVPIQEAAAPVVRQALREISLDGKQLEDKAEGMVAEIAQAAAGEFSWLRFGVGIGLFVLLVALALYTGRIEEYAALYSKLVSAIEILLGGIIGIVLGESAGR